MKFDEFVILAFVALLITLCIAHSVDVAPTTAPQLKTWSTK